MDAMTVIGGALLLWAAYKLGVYVEGRMKAKQREIEAQKDAAPGPQEKA